MRKIILILCMALFMTGLVGCSDKPHMTAYIPIERIQKRNVITLRERPDWLTAQHIINVEKVFDYFRVPYKMHKGNLMITKDLQDNRMALSQYSMRANDPDWEEKEKEKIQQRRNVAPPSGWDVQGAVKTK